MLPSFFVSFECYPSLSECVHFVQRRLYNPYYLVTCHRYIGMRGRPEVMQILFIFRELNQNEPEFESTIMGFCQAKESLLCTAN